MVLAGTAKGTDTAGPFRLHHPTIIPLITLTLGEQTWGFGTGRVSFTAAYTMAGAMGITANEVEESSSRESKANKCLAFRPSPPTP